MKTYKKTEEGSFRNLPPFTNITSNLSLYNDFFTINYVDTLLRC